MERKHDASSLDFSIFDKVKTGDVIVVNGISVRRLPQNREYNEPSRTYSYDFNSLDDRVKYRVHVRVDLMSDVSLGLRHDQMIQKRREAWIVNLRAGEGEKVSSVEEI